MRKIGPFEFPEPGEKVAWRPVTFRRALASKVLVVGRARMLHRRGILCFR